MAPAAHQSWIRENFTLVLFVVAVVAGFTVVGIDVANDKRASAVTPAVTTSPASGAGGSAAKQNARTRFAAFKHKYSRSYRNADEEERRFSYFQDTLADIDQRNRAERASGNPHAAVHGVTKFADYSADELRHLTGGQKQHAPMTKVAPMPYLPPGPVRCSRNWVAESPGAYPHRNQDICNGCWAYALAESMRGAYIAQGGDDPGMLSAEFALDCGEPAWTSKTCGGDTGFQSCYEGRTCYQGCCGGQPPIAMNWAAAVGGLPTAAAYGGRGYDKHVGVVTARAARDPFKAWPCNMAVPKAVRPLGPPKLVTGGGEINMTDALLQAYGTAKATGGNAAALKLMCDERGMCPVKGTNPPKYLSPESVLAGVVCAREPVTIGVNAAWDTYVSGVMTTGACSNATQDHSVVVVGVDAEKQAWIVRNTWGGDWGVAPTPPYTPYAETPGGNGGGYILLAFGENTCRMAELAFAQPQLARV